MWDSWCYDPICTVLILNDAFQGLVIVVDLHYKPQTSFSLNSLCDFAVDVSGFVKEGKKSCGSSSAGSVVASTVGQTNIRHLINQGTTALHKNMIWQTRLSTVVWMNYWAGPPLRLYCVVFLDTIFFNSDLPRAWRGATGSIRSIGSHCWTRRGPGPEPGAGVQPERQKSPPDSPRNKTDGGEKKKRTESFNRRRKCWHAVWFNFGFGVWERLERHTNRMMFDLNRNVFLLL